MLLLSLLVLYNQVEGQVSYVGYRALRVQVATPAQLECITGFDIWSSDSVPRIGTNDIMVPSDMNVTDLYDCGVLCTFLMYDVQGRLSIEQLELDEPSTGQESSCNNYHNFTEMSNIIMNLATYPVVTYNIIGTSYEGRAIYALNITGTVAGPKQKNLNDQWSTSS
jgi:hypothetical protein